VDCAVASDHAAKTQAFTSYTELLGAVVDTRWDFSLQEVCGSVVTKPLLMTPPCQLPSQSRRPNLCCVAWAGIALDGFGASILLLGTLSSQNWNNFCVPSTTMRQKWRG